ncbi:bZIP-1 domain containing protein [Pyrenophora tritici-repentis]|nr:bZIP-1 domain containing protein [Pyrenophora tritici-repentis]
MSRHASHQTDDWTQVTDRAQRRRIQNRIAQRRYREKVRKRLEMADSIIASASHSRDDPSFLKGCVETDTTDLHRDQSSPPQDSSVAPAQQQYKEEPSGALLPAAHSLLPKSGGTTGGITQNIIPSLPAFYSSTAVAVGYPPSNICYINDGGSPFDQGYLAMNGTWVASQHRCL